MLNQVQQRSNIEASWLVTIDSIENHLAFRTLSITLPENNTIYTFEADNVTSIREGEYYWAGYNIDGSSIRLRKGASDFLGNLYIASTNYYYEIASISTDKSVLIKYNPFTINGYGDCAQEEDEDEDIEDTVEDRGGCENNKIRVLFLFTAAAAALGPPSPASVASTIISELHAATLDSEMPETDIFFMSAGEVLFPGFIESNNIGNDLSAFSSSSTVHDLRDDYYADIVVLLTANAYPGVNGQAKRISASNGNAYCIVELPAAISSLTGSHEIAHIVGARHQRCLMCWTGGCDPLTNHHGYPVGDNFKTIMYQLSCAGHRTRIGRFSNPDADFMGFNTGNINNNNAKKLESRAARVSCFREEPPDYGGGGDPYLLVSINGPSTVPNCQGYYPYMSVIAPPFQNPLTYKWEISPIGVGNWTEVSTNNSYILMDPTNWPNYWMTLRLTVTEASGKIGFAHKEIQRVDCLDNGDDRQQTNDGIFPSCYPNPVSDILMLKNIPFDSKATISDANGVQVRDFMMARKSDGQLVFDLAKLTSGMYMLTIQNEIQIFTFKFVKL
ncbi:MAG: T9SS C-terminal target domain-containing protein [Haliscomenobacteraceae bacterium CHB4]|nr:T9SS C-terminal target domain-containing protein [Haliscomenobacteraceae bacterium CHB4]